MSRKGIYKYLPDLVSNFKELVEFSFSSAIVKIAVTNTKPILKKYFDNNLLLRLKHRNKNFWSENANMIFGFRNLHYLDQKFDTLSEISNLQAN